LFCPLKIVDVIEFVRSFTASFTAGSRFCYIGYDERTNNHRKKDKKCIAIENISYYQLAIN